MLIPEGLSGPAQVALWNSTLRTTHMRQIHVRILTLDHKQVTAEMGGMFLDGQANIDTTRDAIGSCQLTLLDPSQSIGWEPHSAKDYPQLKRMVQVIDSRLVPGMGGGDGGWTWIGCPVFTGPVMDFDREGATVTINADSKDRLALGNFPAAKTWKAKLKVIDVIEEMMHSYAGEAKSRMHLPKGLKATLPEKHSVTRQDQIWVHVRRLAASVGYKVLYDGRGHFWMRKAPASAGMTIDRTALCSPVRIDRDSPDIKNRWIVLGPKPKAHKKQISADIALPEKHPWSAQTLGRNNGSVLVPRWLIDQQQPGQVKNHATALKIAKANRDEQLRVSQQVTVDILPMPQIEPYDLVKVVDPLIGAYLIRANQYTLPLGTGGPASLGVVRKASLMPKHKKKSHGHKHHGDGGKAWQAA